MRVFLIASLMLIPLAGAARGEEHMATVKPVAGHAAGGSAEVRFKAVMDHVFGAGAWRETGGYRTQERENQLRAEGAMTVAPGHLSDHSRGRPGAPGAYDAVVTGMKLDAAAEKLRAAKAPFRTILAEGAHGSQGAHLHLAPVSVDMGGGGPPRILWTVAPASPEEEALARLEALAMQGDAAAQLGLGLAYGSGRGAPKDAVAAYVWTAMAGGNPAASPTARRDAERMLDALAARMSPAEVAQARRFAARSACAAPAEEAAVVVLGAPAAPAACPTS